MKAVLISGMSAGVLLITSAVPGIRDIIFEIMKKYLGIEIPSLNPMVSIILGIIIIIGCYYLYKKEDEKIRIVNVFGFGNNEYWETNNKNVETIDVTKWAGIANKNNYIKKKIDETKNIIKKYLASGLSYTGIAPIPIVALIGTCFYKIKIKDYYEYVNKDSVAIKLNNNLKYSKLKLEVKNKESKKNYALITVSTTANIREHQISQFDNCLHYEYKIKNPKQNSIFSKKQLSNYSNIINEQINIISSMNNIKRIYIIFASQSSLAFEVGKQINDRMAIEVVVCHYQNGVSPAYGWGIAISGKNKNKYISLKEE
ncbi:MAG: SAVED domain-containing protein [Bacilli bacterium]